MSDLPKRVLIAEEGPREGFQSEKKMIPVADKVRLIEALADTGLRHIACVSYVNPKRVPTMADAEEVASKIRQKPGIEYSALWLNQQGLERALRGPLHVDGGVRVTASDTFSRKNIGKSVPDAMVEQRMSLKTFKDRGMPVEWGIILGAFGCNYEGELSTELILQRVQLALDEAEMAGFKLKGIKLTDAMGWATPHSVERLIGAVRNKWPELEIALHLHDTRGTGRPPPMPACAWASPSSTPRSPGWAAARSPRPTARPATSAPRTSPSCARRWASRPASTSIG